jgi:SAM-dependent methyltransferase
VSRDLASLLVCPACRRELAAGPDELRCDAGHAYPVVRGVPRLFDGARLSQEQRRTADAFGFSWTHYPRDNPYTEAQWRDWVLPLSEKDFAGRLVLDAGCGLAGFAEYAKGWGARQVVGADLSEAIDAAQERLAGSVDLVQADLHELPFREGTFDVAYSIGVLHHLPNPERGFQRVARMVRPGGRMFAWVYGRESNGWIVHLVDPLRKRVFAHLPRPLLKWAVALPLALLVSALILVAQRFARTPYGDYLRWLGQRDLAFVHGVVFDHLVAPTAHYIRREELAGWFERAGLVDVEITSRNANSWRAVGTSPAPTEDSTGHER